MRHCAELELVVFVGLQASGKSTFFRERFAATHEHVSKDLFRHNKNRDRRQRQLVEAALGVGRSVVVDNTNPALEDRQPLIELGREHGAKVVGYYFEAEVRECVERNRTRSGRDRVPDVAIYVTAKKLVPPSPSEGFDEMFRASLAGAAGFEVVSAWAGGADVLPYTRVGYEGLAESRGIARRLKEG